jgi:hypothetical protein
MWQRSPAVPAQFAGAENRVTVKVRITACGSAVHGLIRQAVYDELVDDPLSI